MGTCPLGQVLGYPPPQETPLAVPHPPISVSCSLFLPNCLFSPPSNIEKHKNHLNLSFRHSPDAKISAGGREGRFQPGFTPPEAIRAKQRHPSQCALWMQAIQGVWMGSQSGLWGPMGGNGVLWGKWGPMGGNGVPSLTCPPISLWAFISLGFCPVFQLQSNLWPSSGARSPPGLLPPESLPAPGLSPYPHSNITGFMGTPTSPGPHPGINSLCSLHGLPPPAPGHPPLRARTRT